MGSLRRIRTPFRPFYVLLFALVPLGGCGADAPSAPKSQSAPAQGAPDQPGRPTVLFLGDSLAAGYGLDPALAYPALIQRRIESSGLDYEVVNAGVSGDTTAGGLRRFDWLAKRRIDVLVLALGGNDGLRGIDVASARQNLQGIIDKARSANPGVRILLAGMRAPPNMGSDFTEPFRAIFPELAEQNDLALVPFLLEGVGGEPQLNQPDGIHPTPEGQVIVAENVWRVLGPILREPAE